MAIIKVDDIIKATEGELLSENSKTFSGVSIDSRTSQDGELFIALRGERFDGHDYLEDALAKGSGAVVAMRPGPVPAGKVIIHVRDTLRSLQDLAHFLRTKRDVPVVAVTGSNGKTTTKEMIYTIVSSKMKTLKNEGNLNNHIGLPLSITRLAGDEDVIVLEMGMNAPGEIRRLCEIAVPSHGVITNVGTAHVGKLGSYEAVRDAKLEILEGLSVAVINADDVQLMNGVGLKEFGGQIVTFGINNDSHVMAKNVRPTEQGSTFVMEIRDRGSTKVRLNVLGLFNVYNALAASAVSVSLGMGLDEIRDALETYGGVPMRFELIRKKGMTVVNDAYNANPSSMDQSIRELLRIRTGGRAVAVLGDMHELDEFSEKAHREVGELVSALGLDVFVAVGDMMGLAAEEAVKSRVTKAGPEVYTFKNINDARSRIMDILKKGDTVLIKGSRSVRMERIIEGITDAL
jgi:UDP-N-acetylmuramoyl-tripeptide--D-alanyl-D-alanine ligase